MSKTVQSVERALAILEVLANSEGGLGTTEIGEITNLHKSTAHRLLSTLIGRGFVEQDPDTNNYSLSLKLFELGAKRISNTDLLTASRRHTPKLVKEVNEVVHVVVRDGPDIVYIDKVESDHTIRMASTIGRRSPAYSTSVGKAILAHLDPAVVEEIWQASNIQKFTNNTITDLNLFKAELNKINQLGYSTDDEENEIGVFCVGAPVFGLYGEIQGAISISGPAYRMRTRKIEELGEIVKTYGHLISKELGYV